MNKRKKIKYYLYSVVLLLTLFNLINCNNNIEIPENQNKTFKYKIKDKSFKELKNETNFKKAISKINTNNKAISFTIDSTNVREFFADNYTSYTFAIERDNPNIDYFENLVVVIDSLSIAYPYIIKYIPTEPIQYFQEHNSFSFVGETEITPIDLNKNVNADCIYVLVTYCSETGVGASGTNYADTHVATGDCNNSGHLFTTEELVCTDNSAGSNNGNNSSNNGNSQVGHGPNSSGLQVVTSPIKKLQAWEKVVNCLGLFDNSQQGTNPDPEIEEQRNWLQTHKTQSVKIDNYLQNNSCSQNAQEYIFNVLEISMSENPAIDINQILDAFNVSLDFNDCTSKLIRKSFITKGFLDNTAFGEKIKNTFILNDNTHISFKPVTDQNSTTSAKTNYVRVTNPTDPVTGQQIIGDVVTIEFNVNYLNQANDIAIVTTIFHEILHAYIVELYYSGTLLSICPEYTELNDAFNAFVNDPNYPGVSEQINQTIIDNLDDKMHNIYEDYIEDLAESIHTYAIKNNFKINNNVISLDYARNLIWGSLQNENVFQNCPTQYQARQTFNNNMQNNLSNSDETPTKSCN